MSALVSRIRYLKHPSLARLSEILSARLGRTIALRRTREGLEVTVDGELTDPQREKLELIMERLGYIEEAE